VPRPEPDDLVEEQIAYYRARAPEYDDWWLRTGRFAPDDDFGRRWEAGKRDLEDALRAFAPGGEVLELAAGTGNLTARLAAQPEIEHITAVDSSEEALAIARTKVPDGARVTFVTADLFSWQPARRYDVVAFGFWLSHVPPPRFEGFWDLVRSALRPGGRVFFVDNAVPVEQAAAAGGRQVETPWSRTWLDQGVSLRTLADGREFRIIKRAWTPAELEAELAALGWSARVEEHQRLFISGEAISGEAISGEATPVEPREHR
jgi:demethylmenaquinone methyltransferase/2-methoxy-6-polyprenyl-1,4-benzoquinol methylase